MNESWGGLAAAFVGAIAAVAVAWISVRAEPRATRQLKSLNEVIEKMDASRAATKRLALVRDSLAERYVRDLAGQTKFMRDLRTYSYTSLILGSILLLWGAVEYLVMGATLASPARYLFPIGVVFLLGSIAISGYGYWFASSVEKEDRQALVTSLNAAVDGAPAGPAPAYSTPADPDHVETASSGTVPSALAGGHAIGS